MLKTRNAVYQIVETIIFVEDSGMITTYGLSCDKEIIPDISTRSALVEELIDRLNDNEADPIHLKDFIYDFLP